ncbi:MULTISPECIES: sugar ABC transporter permease [unclassified Streptomyces]|uniref:sugar ABC transporter permease n=1 Tax=Streptomycetaceae TaxID=2062 RepID=UPI002E7A99D6|nr:MULTISPECIES: sugar ABC transporter permease [unclassified Streptomyces]MED7954593.1 sugar ABC transporter permease [Streptomyces sp. BE303]MEE1829225.1 sugar ABC transporter permease [Streptomyces sp. BE20]
MPKGGVNAPVPVAPEATPAVDPRLIVRQEGVKGYLGEFRRRLGSGELGSLPVVLALIVIWAVFGSLNSSFLSAQNLSNLSQQIVGTGMIAIGVVFVLLLGEIDLSVGSVSGLCAAIFAVMNVTHGVNQWVALIVAVAGGAVVGLIQGLFFAKVGVPAFVVTLAGNLGWNGAMLQILGSSGTVNLSGNDIVSRLYSTIYGQQAAAYGAALVGVALFLLATLVDTRRRQRAGVPSRPIVDIVLRTAVLAVIAFLAAYTLNQYKGLPLALLIFLIFIVVLDFVLRRTRYGRQVFALGGNIEGARRAGINVSWIRISVFVICSTMAGIGGLFLAAQIQSASQTSGGGNLLMNAIAAAVIGGTSLFGGRGKTWSALLGALVIGSIQSGMNIQGLSNAIQFMITGAVLLAAVVIDSLARRTQQAAGRA